MTSATPDGNGGYVINGEKWFVTVGDVADVFIVLAYVQPEKAPTMFLIDADTPGVRMTHVPRSPTPSSTSIRSSPSRTSGWGARPFSAASAKVWI